MPVCLPDTWLNQVIERICQKGPKDTNSRSSRAAQHRPLVRYQSSRAVHKWWYPSPEPLLLDLCRVAAEPGFGRGWNEKRRPTRVEILESSARWQESTSRMRVKRWPSGLPGWRKAGPGMHKRLATFGRRRKSKTAAHSKGTTDGNRHQRLNARIEDKREKKEAHYLGY